jgi:tRNA(Ile)-lysidine synthase
MEQLREQQALVRAEVERRWNELAVGHATSLRRGVIAEWPVALAHEALRHAAEQVAGPPSPLERRHLRRLRVLARTGTPRRLDLPGGLEAVVEGPVLRLGRRDAAPTPPTSVTLVVPGTVRFGPWEVRAERRRVAAARETSGPFQVWVRSAGPFIVRGRRAGDRFRPLGGSGTVTVQDELVNRKVPRNERALLPVIAVADRIVWLVGSRVSAEEAVTEGELATWLEARRDS